MFKYTTRPVVLRQLFDRKIHNEIVSFMDNYIPMLPLDVDTNDWNRTYANNVGFFRNIHKQLADFASDVFGEKVKPSYSFVSMYNKGGQCPLHVDRPQCRYTIDYLIRQDHSEPWPLRIGTPMSDEELNAIAQKHPSSKTEIKQVVDNVDWTEVHLKPNDAVCYSGTNCWHYRPTKSKGKADLVFFHFVPEAFNGSLE